MSDAATLVQLEEVYQCIAQPMASDVAFPGTRNGTLHIKRLVPPNGDPDTTSADRHCPAPKTMFEIVLRWDHGSSPEGEVDVRATLT